MLAILFLVIAVAVLTTAQQTVFADDRYTFDWPIKDVAIIGAGASGLLSYRALAENGQFNNIRVFERDTVPGGNWHYTEEIPQSVPVTNGNKSDWWRSDYAPAVPQHLPTRKTHVAKDKTSLAELERLRLNIRQPKPIWETLRANTPAPQQQLPGFPWPPHVSWATPHRRISQYLRSFASWLGINTNDESSDISYNTRVEKIIKRSEGGRQRGWTLVLHKFVQVKEGHYEETWWEEHFDAVIVASGRFNVPHIPDIPGLAEWQKRFPEQILHSRQYRYAEPFRGKNVIVVGASASATGISEDINTFVSKSYLSIRETSDDPRAPVRRATHLVNVPSNTSIIGEIKAFHPAETSAEGRIELLNGTIITGIDAIIFGTGFRYAFPFLEDYHSSASTIPKSAEHSIVTDGTHVQSLYLDVFYIDQPTIAFQGQNVGIQTFVYGKYVGSAIAKVWSGQAHLPSRAQMWRHFWDTVEERGGLKKGLQWLNGEANLRYLRFFTAWLNSASSKYGGELVDTPPDVTEVMTLWQAAKGIIPNEDGRNDFWGPSSSGLWTRAILDDW